MFAHSIARFASIAGFVLKNRELRSKTQAYADEILLYAAGSELFIGSFVKGVGIGFGLLLPTKTKPTAHRPRCEQKFTFTKGEDWIGELPCRNW
jgi:hypothetical protein